MSRIAVGFTVFDITENKYVETRMTGHMCMHTRSRQKNSPWDEPYWKEYYAHHAKEAHEKVCIHSVDGFDVSVICLKDRYWPCQ